MVSIIFYRSAYIIIIIVIKLILKQNLQKCNVIYFKRMFFCEDDTSANYYNVVNYEQNNEQGKDNNGS